MYILGCTSSSAIIYLSSSRVFVDCFVKNCFQKCLGKNSGEILCKYLKRQGGVQPTIIVVKKIHFLEEQLGNRISMYDRRHFKAYYLVHFWPHFWLVFENHKSNKPEISSKNDKKLQGRNYKKLFRND